MSRIGRELAGNNSLSVKQQTIQIIIVILLSNCDIQSNYRRLSDLSDNYQQHSHKPYIQTNTQLPQTPSKYYIYYLLLCMLCFSGSTYQVTEQFMSNFGVAHISAETYYRFQSQYVIPAVERMYVNQERQVLNDMIERGMSLDSYIIHCQFLQHTRG